MQNSLNNRKTRQPVTTRHRHTREKKAVNDATHCYHLVLVRVTHSDAFSEFGNS
jgi:hypothetical protein